MTTLMATPKRSRLRNKKYQHESDDDDGPFMTEDEDDRFMPLEDWCVMWSRVGIGR